MRYRQLGRTGLTVSEISLGGLFFGKLAAGRDTGATVARAAELGINLIDTAAAYTGSEEELGRVLAEGLRRKFLIATKWWPYMDDGRTMKVNPAELQAAVEGSLRRLRTDTIDLFLFHSLTFPGDVERVRHGPLWYELDRLKHDGKIRHIGLSNSGSDDPEDDRLTEAAREEGFEVVMPEFLLFRQRAVRAALPTYRRAHVGVIGIMPLGQAAWGYGLRDRTYLADSLKTLREKGALPDAPEYRGAGALDFLLDDATPTIAAAALRFCLSYDGISTVCCGTNDPEHLTANAAVSDAGPLDDARLARAEELFGRL
ncbi:MAG: aldo/keto reductase [bacterium]